MVRSHCLGVFIGIVKVMINKVHFDKRYSHQVWYRHLHLKFYLETEYVYRWDQVNHQQYRLDFCKKLYCCLHFPNFHLRNAFLDWQTVIWCFGILLNVPSLQLLRFLDSKIFIHQPLPEVLFWKYYTTLTKIDWWIKPVSPRKWI